MKKVLYLTCLLSVFSNSILAQFGPELIITTSADFANHVVAADLDNDGDLDVISASDSDNKIAWYQNLGDGTFGLEFLLTDQAGSANEIFVIDVDGDNDVDVFAATDDYLIWFENNGDETFQPLVQISTGPTRISSVFVVDVDGDGLPDVIGSFINLDKVVWYKNNGNGTFGSENLISNLTNSPLSIFAIDLNGNGFMDVLSTSLFDNKVAWYQNDGFGNFSAQQIISDLSNSPRSVFSQDIDDDNDNDVLVAYTSDDKIAWYKNDGSGTFGNEIIISNVADGAQSVYAVDLDSDGDIDVLSSSETDDKLAWYENDGLGNLATEQIISTAADGPQHISAGDIDGDGNLDILSASRQDDKIAWYKNLINDLDDDGVLNENDCAPLDPLLFEGAVCDDSNPFTDDDMINSDCVCIGIVSDPQDHFVTTWKTNNPGTSNSASVTIPTFLGETYNYDVDWNNDGIFDQFGIDGNATHNYGTSGEYTIRIKGDFPRIYFTNSGDRQKIISIDQWGTTEWTSMANAFWGCSNMLGLATDAPDLSAVQDMNRMFNNAFLFNQDIGDWDISNVTSTISLFREASSFNQDLGNWDVSNVVYMDGMFENAVSFNQDIGDWNTSSLEVTYVMFKNAEAFDQNIGNWDVTNVVDMEDMFAGAGLSTVNYDSLLIGWSTQNLTTDVFFNGGSSQYCEGSVARQVIIDNFNWEIIDNGEEANCGQECYDIDKNTLQALHLELGSPLLTNWNFSPEIAINDSWQGIGVTLDGCQVDSLDLNGLGLSGTFEEVGNLPALRYLRMGNNNLTGNIPNTLLNHANLEYFNLTDNTGLTGVEIPAALGTIPSLEFLYLGGNDLGGIIPASFGNLINLNTLDLSGNQLTGSIPTFLGSNFTELERLYLYNNQLSGTLPTEIGSVPNLLILWLHGNDLEDCTPYAYTNHCDADVRMDLNPLLNNQDFYNFCETATGGCAGSISLNLKTFLQGPYQSGSELMTDNIRFSGSFPLTEPYQGVENIVVGGREEITDSNVLLVSGNDAIVDWIFVEFRDGNNPTNVLQTKSALLQKDGDIVSSIDGTSTLTFHNPSGTTDNVVVALRHRNHFGVRTDIPQLLSGSGSVISIDFSDPLTSLFGGSNATQDVSGVRTLYAGDANGDGVVNAIDENNFWLISNGLSYDYNFSKADFNLDGVVNAIDKNNFWRLNNGKSEILD